MYFRKPLDCFFCGAVCPTARMSSSSSNGRAGCSFRCAECGCLNRYDARGEIMSDEPAMHDESLNARSFAKRASPRKNRLPSEFTSSVTLCQHCKTNQTLIINLRASFLPDPSDPEYRTRLAQWPAYEQSLYARYPPVCADCERSVEAEISRKDALARVSAFGGFLRETKGKERARMRPDAVKPKTLEKNLIVWRTRGILWASTTLSAIALEATYAFGIAATWVSPNVLRMGPLFVLVSVIWSFWDPKYLAIRQARLLGKKPQAKGRGHYIRLQAAAWVLRLITVSLIVLPSPIRLSMEEASSGTRIYFGLAFSVELLILALSAYTLRDRRPPKVRLLDTSSSRGRLSAEPISRQGSSEASSSRYSTPAPAPETDCLASLSLSNHPVLPHNPVFGASSLSAPAPVPRDPDVQMVDEDAMDWMPAAPASTPPRPAEDDGSWLRPQRFFAPEQPTGLEGLLARTGLSDVVPETHTPSSRSENRPQSQWQWGWVYAVSIIPLIGIGVHAWMSRQPTLTSTPLSTPLNVPHYVAIPQHADIPDYDHLTMGQMEHW